MLKQEKYDEQKLTTMAKIFKGKYNFFYQIKPKISNNFIFPEAIYNFNFQNNLISWGIFVNLIVFAMISTLSIFRDIYIIGVIIK